MITNEPFRGVCLWSSGEEVKHPVSWVCRSEPERRHTQDTPAPSRRCAWRGRRKTIRYKTDSEKVQRWTAKRKVVVVIDNMKGDTTATQVMARKVAKKRLRRTPRPRESLPGLWQKVRKISCATELAIEDWNTNCFGFMILFRGPGG